MKKEEHIVIVGNSGAAINAVKGIRQVNAQCSITLLSSEPHNAYSPVLTTYLIAGKITRNQMALVDEAFYRYHRVECRYKQRAISLNPTDQKVFLEDGTAIHYDKVLIATGALPNLLDCDLPAGLPIFKLRTLEDAEKIQSRISNWRNVIFAGAGLVSIQIANAIRKYLKGMVFIVGSDQILSQNLDKRASSLIQGRVEAEAGTFLLNRKIIGIEGSQEEVVVHTDRGEAITGNALIVGKGVRPNIPKFVPEGVVEVSRGIRVDRQMRTSAEAIYAAGDVCEAKDLISGKYRLISNWPNACFQGLVAGQNIGGGEAFFEGSLAMNVTSVFGLSFASIGEVRDDPGEGRETSFYLDESRGVYKKWVFQDDRLIGAILVGDIGENAFVAEIIRRQQSISREKKALMGYPSNAASILCGLL
jgi:NAD(P)H-nitrite reductase large subunit